MNYGPPGAPVNETAFHRGPRSRVEFVAIPTADGRQKLPTPACELANAASRIARSHLDTIRIEIEVVGVAKEVTKSFQFANGAYRM